MIKLSQLRPPKGARHKKKRVGFGEGSGHGKTSSRGGKGQTARTGGKVRAGFEGGQMPLYRRLPKYGFTSQSKVLGLNVYSVVNLSDLESFANGTVIDDAALRAKGVVKGRKRTAGIKVLGSGELTKKLQVKVNAVSASARAKIESLGGTVELI